MSAPLIQSTAPAPGETDVVLGRAIIILFDQPVNPQSLSSATFSLQGPGQTAIVASDGSIISDVTAPTGREYITGTFTFPAPGPTDTFLQNQQLIFTPAATLRAGVIYTVLLVGATSVLATTYIKNPAGEAMAESYKFTFTTGTINESVTPPTSPVAQLNPWELPVLDPSQIQVSPKAAIGNNLSTVTLTFPAPIDPNSFSPSDLLVALEPLLGDPSIIVDPASASINIAGNTMTITISTPVNPPVNTSTGRTPVSIYGIQPPTTGDWLQGDSVVNTIPVSGGNIGWICVAGGNPGTWEPYGIIG